MDTYIRTETSKRIVFTHLTDGTVLIVTKTHNGAMEIQVQMPAAALASHGAQTWQDIVAEMTNKYNIIVT